MIILVTVLLYTLFSIEMQVCCVGCLPLGEVAILRSLLCHMPVVISLKLTISVNIRAYEKIATCQATQANTLPCTVWRLTHHDVWHTLHSFASSIGDLRTLQWHNGNNNCHNITDSKTLWFLRMALIAWQSNYCLIKSNKRVTAVCTRIFLRNVHDICLQSIQYCTRAEILF
jgi:hypothetical protein